MNAGGPDRAKSRVPPHIQSEPGLPRGQLPGPAAPSQRAAAPGPTRCQLSGTARGCGRRPGPAAPGWSRTSRGGPAPGWSRTWSGTPAGPGSAGASLEGLRTVQTSIQVSLTRLAWQLACQLERPSQCQARSLNPTVHWHSMAGSGFRINFTCSSFFTSCRPASADAMIAYAPAADSEST